MSQVRLEWTGEALQFIGRTGYGGPVGVGGDPDGAGAKPSDLLAMSLAACTAYDVVVISRKQRQELRGLRVDVTFAQDPEPPWTFRSIHMSFTLTGDIDRRKAERAIELADKECSVAATLRPVVEITHSLEVTTGQD